LNQQAYVVIEQAQQQGQDGQAGSLTGFPLLPLTRRINQRRNAVLIWAKLNRVASIFQFLG